MARIRSIHPGMASDEVFMSLSMPAKAAWPLLWTECDDHGVFEWKPVVLKARIFPADNIDFAAILTEMESLCCVRRFESDGRQFGVVRNFCKYQRPKYPSYRLPFPPEQAVFAAFVSPSTTAPDVALHQPSPNAPEKSLQMEREKREEGQEERLEPNGSLSPDDVVEAFNAWNAAAVANGLPIARSLTADRRVKLKARLREHGLGGWRAALAQIPEAPHLLGGNDRGWRADLDFLLRPDKLNRLADGAYRATSPRGQSPPRSALMQAAGDWISEADDGHQIETSSHSDVELFPAGEGRQGRALADLRVHPERSS